MKNCIIKSDYIFLCVEEGFTELKTYKYQGNKNREIDYFYYDDYDDYTNLFQCYNKNNLALYSFLHCLSYKL